MFATLPFDNQPQPANVPKINFLFRVKEIESLWENTYLDIPLSSYPLTGEFQLDSTRGEHNLKLRIGEKKDRQIDLSSFITYLSLNSLPIVHLEWKTPELKLPQLFKGLANITRTSGSALDGIRKLQKINVPTGTLKTYGNIKFPWKKFNIHSKNTEMEAKIELRNFSLRWYKRAFAFKNLNLNLPFSSKKSSRGDLSFEKLYFRRLESHLDLTRFDISSKHLTIGTEKYIPFFINELPFKLGKSMLTWNSGPQILNTSLNLGHIPVQKITELICEEQLRLPAIALTAKFKKIEITPNAATFIGDAHLFGFDGFVRMNQLKILSSDNSTPDYQFNLDFDHIRLDQLGQWIGFGEMDGLLTGYIHNGTIQGGFPTNYDFKVDLKSHSYSEVKFSPQAMKNLVLVASGTDLSFLPPLANWIAFGPPMSLRGGYNLKYAGLSIHSKGSHIVLETHDPPDHLFRHPNLHLILNGKNFKMPLNSVQYPLVIDKKAMSDFTQRMLSQLGNIEEAQAEKERRARNLKRERKYEIIQNCQPPDF